MRDVPRIAACLLSLVAAAAPAVALDEDDYYLSLPSGPQGGGIYRLDSDTLLLEPFAVGLGIPFYGVWSVDGSLYIPDRALGAVFKISDTGVITPFAAGGLLSTPVTIAESPSGQLAVSDIFQETVVLLDAQGNQTLLHDAVTSGGLIAGPGGLGYGPDGTLYVSNNTNDTVAGIDTGGQAFLASDGGGLLNQPGGLAVDGSGNLFIASYNSNLIVRIRLATGEAEVFCDDPFMVRPNDVKLSHLGGLLVTTRNSSLVHIDALGQLSVISQDTSTGEWDGVAVPNDHPPCTGRFIPYGAGLAGSAGITPELGGIFSPCIGAGTAIEVRGVLGGTTGSLAWGIGPGSVPFKQGQLLVDVTQAWALIPLVFPGVGAGAGRIVVPFELPDEPLFVGISLYLQVLAVDPGAPAGVSMSNGLQELIGN